MAYSLSELSLPKDPIKAHELRAISTSIAELKGVPLNEIMRAAFWRSEGTFLKYYLRDVRSTRMNGSFGIDHLVVAQTVVSAPFARS